MEQVSLLPSDTSQPERSLSLDIPTSTEPGPSGYRIRFSENASGDLRLETFPVYNQSEPIPEDMMIHRPKAAARLEELYSIEDPAPVWRFLYTHPHLAKILIDAHSYCEQFFGPDLRPRLQVVTDPEIRDWKQLFAYIYTSLAADEAVTRLSQLRQAWFARYPPNVDHLLMFSLMCT